MLKARLPLIILLLLTAVYIANCFTPLRLTNDTVRYIGIKEWMEAGKPADDPASKEFLPYGYVWFLLILSKLGLATSLVISFIQFCYLLGSVWFIKNIFGEKIKGWQLMALCMLSWASMKFVITPLSEMQFLFFSMGALYFFRSSKFIWAFVFTAAAMLTRTIGFVLIIAFILSVFWKNRQAVGSFIWKNKLIISGALAVLIVLFFLFDQFGIPRYLSNHSNYFQPLYSNPVGFIRNNFEGHLIDWSALVLNAPAPRIGVFGNQWVFLIVGLLSFAFLISRKIEPEIKAYFLCYSTVIFAWPLFEPRLWVPIFPLCIAMVLMQKRSKVLSAYIVVYSLVGVTALGYYTYTSLNKKILPVKQDVGIWRNEYEVHFFGKPLSDTAKTIRQPIVNILKKYD